MTMIHRTGVHQLNFTLIAGLGEGAAVFGRLQVTYIFLLSITTITTTVNTTTNITTITTTSMITTITCRRR